ncbi:unnamed protein product [Boreogadus saida]
MLCIRSPRNTLSVEPEGRKIPPQSLQPRHEHPLSKTHPLTPLLLINDVYLNSLQVTGKRSLTVCGIPLQPDVGLTATRLSLNSSFDMPQLSAACPVLETSVDMVTTVSNITSLISTVCAEPVCASFG